MLMNYTFVPFLLALNAIVPDGTTNFNAEYLFDYSKTTVVYREPLQTTQLTATLICQPILPRTFRCFLQNIMFLTTLKYQNLNVTEEVSREHIKSEQWFETNFNERGIQDILVHIKSDKMLRSIFKDIANQFNVGGELMARMLNMPISHLPSPGFRFTEKEKTPIGTCRTHYYMNVVYGHNERSEKQDSKFQIVPLVMTEHFVQQRNARIRIAKNRHNCEYSVEFNSFLNGMEIDEYLYTMEIINDKLKMSTIMEVQLPSDPWNLSGSLVFTETTLLDLTNIRTPQTVVQDEPYIWTSITI